MPGTPLGMDPRGPHPMDLAAAINHARAGLEKSGAASDYFLGAPQYPAGNMRPRSPMISLPGHDFYHGNGLATNSSNHNALGLRERDRERDLEQTRKYVKALCHNLSAALMNSQILPPVRYAQVHPMKCEDGSFPPDYDISKTVEAMKVLDNSQLDRIMQAYRLPLDLRPVHTGGQQSRDSSSSSRITPCIFCYFEGSLIGILCIFLCIALGIANIFNPPLIIVFSIICLISGLVLIFVEVPLLLRICPTSEKFDVFIRRFTTNYMRAGMYGIMSLLQWLTLIRKTTSLLASAVFLLLAGICYLIAGLKGQGFVGSKTLGGQGVAQMIV
ncbi:MAG: hypothetical protein Q9168_005161 [Polycauliona sp. 1 TL-2023]